MCLTSFEQPAHGYTTPLLEGARTEHTHVLLSSFNSDYMSLHDSFAVQVE